MPPSAAPSTLQQLQQQQQSASPSAAVVQLSVALEVANVPGSLFGAALRLAYRQSLCDVLYLPLSYVGEVVVADASQPAGNASSWLSGRRRLAEGDAALLSTLLRAPAAKTSSAGVQAVLAASLDVLGASFGQCCWRGLECH